MRRLTLVYATGVVAAAGLVAGSQSSAASGTVTAHWVLATARPGQSITASVKAPSITLGSASQMLIVGVPGSTDEIADPADLPPTAVMMPGNQLDSTPGFGTSSLAVTFSAPRSGDYPVFLMASDAPMCHSQRMDEMPTSTSLDQVGIVRVS